MLLEYDPVREIRFQQRTISGKLGRTGKFERRGCSFVSALDFGNSVAQQESESKGIIRHGGFCAVDRNWLGRDHSGSK